MPAIGAPTGGPLRRTVMLVALMVVGSIASLKVALTSLLLQKLVAPLPGVVDVTVGGVLSMMAAADVAKVHT